MTSRNPQELGFLAKLVLACALVLLVSGIAWHGITVAVFERIWYDIIRRPSEPMAFRFILQPLMAAIAATVDGLKDARRDRSPYFWTMLTKPQERIPELREGLNATARIVLLGIAMDVVYQILVLKRFYPDEALIIALLLAFVPYVVLRGLVLRSVSAWHKRPSAHGMS